MAFDTIKAGLRVFTNARASRKGGVVGGGLKGAVYSVIRHPLSRNVLAVIVAPEGVTDPDEFIVTSARNLRAA